MLKKYIHSGFELYIDSSIHVALAVVSFAGITSFYLDLRISALVYLFLFFSSVTAYNFTKYYHTWFRSDVKSISVSQIITGITMFCILGMAVTAAQLPVKVLFITIIPTLLTLLYVLPVFPKHTGLRQIYGVKIFIISLTWAISTVWLPVVSSESQTNISIHLLLIEFIQRFFLVFALTLPFDIRDVRTDSGILTSIPAIIGLRKTRLLAGIFLLLIVISEIFRPGSEAIKTILLLLFAILIFIAVYNSHYRQKSYYASFWVEGIPIAWFFIILIVVGM